MSKQTITDALKPLLQQEVTQMGPQGLILAGIALLVHTDKERPNFAQDVADFHKKFGIRYEGPPRNLPKDVAEFRRKRQIEELEEYEVARVAGDVVGQFDAVIDELYFLYGKAQLNGFTPQMLAEGWRRVHEANMNKVRATPDKPGKYTKEGCRQDITKPPGWVAPYHEDIIDEETLKHPNKARCN